MADDVASRVVVELIANTRQLDDNVRRSATEFSGAMSNIERSATRAEGTVTRSAGQMAQSSRNLGYQISDIGVQLAGGQNPFLIIAQQAPQVANALEGATGAAGRMAAFFSGPWGAALLAAGSLLGVIISKSYDSADGHAAHAKAAKTLEQAIDDLNTALGRAIQSEAQVEVGAYNASKGLLTQAFNARNATAAMIDLARAQLRVDQIRQQAPGQRGETAALNVDSDTQRLAGLDALYDKNQASLAKARDTFRAAEIPILQRQVAASTDASAAANQRFSRTQDGLNTAFRAGRISIEEYRSKLADATRAREAALDATKRHSTATGHHARVSHEASDAIRDEERALKALQSTLDSLVSAYDPALAALQRYRKELSDIDALVANPKIKLAPEEADKLRSGAERQYRKTNADAFHLDSIDGIQADVNDKEAADKEAAANQRRLDDELQRHREGQVRTLASLYEDLFTGGTQRLWDDFKQIGLRIIAEVIAKMTIAKLFGGASASEGGDFISTLKSVASSAFSGGRASGGDVEAGRLYRVNETGGGVEGFRPAGSGTIIPLGSMPAAMQSGGTVVQQFFTLDARGGITTPQLLAHVNQVAAQKAAQAGQVSYRSAVAAAPGAIQRQNELGNS